MTEPNLDPVKIIDLTKKDDLDINNLYMYKGDLISEINLTSLAKKNTIHLIPQDAVLPATSAPALVKIDGTNHSYNVLDFDPAVDEQCFWHFSMPINWDGENVIIHIKYIANATTGVVVWGFYCNGASESQVVDRALNYVFLVSDTVDAVANELCILSVTDVDTKLTGITPGEWGIIKLKRNADGVNDTLTVDARVLEVMIEWNLKQ